MAEASAVVETTDWKRIAIEGQSIDDRRISRQEVVDCAETFNTDTLKPRMFVEHLRGITIDSPFGAMGDMVDAKWQIDEVEIGGKKEKRAALYGRFDLFAPLIEAQNKGQKLYTSVEIKPNLGGSGRSGLIGVGVTDSPAALCNQALRFSAILGEDVLVSEPQEVEFTASADGGNEMQGMLAEMKKMFSSLTKKDDGAAPQNPKEAPKPKPAEPSEEDNVRTFAAALEKVGEAMATGFSAIAKRQDASDAEFKALKKQLDEAPATNFARRPKADGTKTDGEIIY